jgi:putative transposase
VDFRRLNAVTTSEEWPPLLVPQLVQRLAGSDWLSSLDLANAYFQIPLSSASQPKTAFSAPSGRYQFTAVPFVVFQTILLPVVQGASEQR